MKGIERKMSYQMTTLGGVQRSDGRQYSRKTAINKANDFDQMAGSTFSSRCKVGDIGLLEMRGKPKALSGWQQQQSVSLNRPKTASAVPEGEKDDDEVEEEVERAASPPKPLEELLPELHNYSKMAAARDEKERRQRKEAVSARLEAFDEGLDQIYHSVTGTGNYIDRVCKVKIIRGKNLPICDAKKSDPYVKLSLNGNVKYSSVQRANLNPVWHENFTFKVRGGNERRNVLHVDVYDQDLLPADYNNDGDDFMGGFEVSLEDHVQLDVPLRQWWKLKGGDLHEVHGETQMQNGQVELEVLVTHAGGNMGSMAGSTKSGVRSEKKNMHRGAEQHPPSITMTDDTKRMVLVGHVGRLRHASPDVRHMAVRALAKTAGKRGCNLPKQGGWEGLMVKHLTDVILKDPSAEVRLDALEALVMTSARGGAGAIKATAHALRDSSRDVRLAAVTAMRQIAESGDEIAIFSVAERLEDSDYKVRETAGEVLGKLSTEHDPRLVSQVLLRLKSIHSVIRKNSVRTLVTVATPGSPQVLDGLKLALKDSDGQVRIAAMSVLRSQVSRGVEPIVTIVLGHLNDAVPDVRAAAAECLSHIAAKSDKRVIHALTALLEDDGKDIYGHMTVRQAALHAISHVAKDGDGASASPRTKSLALKGAIDSLGESDWWVRLAAAGALAAICSNGGLGESKDVVMERLVLMLQDDIPQVRKVASKTLGLLVKPDDFWITSSLAVSLCSKSAEIRTLVATILQQHVVDGLRFKGVRVARRQGAFTPGKPSSPLAESIGRCSSSSGEILVKDFEEFASRKKNVETVERYFLDTPSAGDSVGSTPQLKLLERDLSGGEDSACSPHAMSSPRRSPRRASPTRNIHFLSRHSSSKRTMFPPAGSFSKSGGMGVTGRMGATSPMGQGGGSHTSPVRSSGSRASSPREESDSENEEEPRWMWAVRHLRKVKNGRQCSAEEAIRVLECCVDPGEERALEGLVWSLNHPNEHVREVTIHALQRVCKAGQPNVVAALQERMKLPRWEFRRDAALALSLVANKDDPEVSKSIMALLDDDVREVRACVEEAATNMFFPGDDRIIIAGASVRLEHKYHSKEERQEALAMLGNLAFQSSHTKLLGYSVDDADMEAFWKRLRMPKETSSDSQKTLPKILELFSDDDPWVRRAAVRASVECSKREDKAVMRGLTGLLEDGCFTVRVVSVHALASLSDVGNVYVIQSLQRKIDDHSHLVRQAAAEALQHIVPIGDRYTGGQLLRWLRESWQYRKSRGDDFEVKAKIARIIVDSMGFPHGNQDCVRFTEGILHKSMHAQRNAVARFEDHLIQQGLLEPRQLTTHFQTVLSAASYGPAHRAAVMRIQRWVRNKALINTVSRFRMKLQKTKEKYKKQAVLPGQRAKSQRKKAPLWFMQEEDKMAEKVVKNKVPEQVRNTAISTAHEKALGGQDDMDHWERMRWTERLRLCEEIAQHPW